MTPNPARPTVALIYVLKALYVNGMLSSLITRKICVLTRNTPFKEWLCAVTFQEKLIKYRIFNVTQVVLIKP